MTDAVFKAGINRAPLFQFRVKNSGDYRYIKADNLHDASRRLATMGFEPDTLQYVGEIVDTRKPDE